MTTSPDFNDPSLPTIVVGHPAIINFRGEEVLVASGLLEEAIADLDRVEGEMEKDTFSVESGKRFLRQIYEIVDRVGEGVAPGMSCHSGCSACCRVMVATTAGEASLIEDRMEKSGPEKQVVWKTEIEKRNALLENLARRQTPPSDLTTFKGLLETCEMYERENQPCPFLGGDRLCQIYEDRPLLCRICWVLTDPADCLPDAGPPVKFRTRVFEKAHALCGLLSRRHFGDHRVSPIPFWFQGDNERVG
ncbi:YkgJ family cysteine cluster protein [Leptospirillum ferriphilum]|uniref:YkgJ family cysteine cluster protein n=1 Tax=Leptospirillum ferriphilum TaxID=178606 RepID=UPI000987466B|nr:YkgJ family cysteine cluster protein [Leptospirillum ferriphilum]OOH82392.1 zinc/iron-chelating domain-containing protein [Leptospirillum ferriphilum]